MAGRTSADYTAARQLAALDIQRSRGLSVQSLPEEEGFRVVTKKGAALSTNVHVDPVDALEEAESIIVASAIRTEEAVLKRISIALQAAKHVIWPQEANGMMQWSVMQVSDRKVLSTHAGWLEAGLEIERLVNLTKSVVVVR